MEYDDRLERAIERTPDIEGGDERFSVPEVSVRQEGSVALVENLQAVADRLDRDDDHVLSVLQKELGTSGHVDESGRGRLTGEFDADRVQAALETYVEAFVRCPECGLPDTHLEREQGARLIACDACGARSPAGTE